MKKIILIFSSLIVFNTGHSQQISVSEGTEKFSTGNQNALTVNLIENTKSNLEDAWKSYLKNYKHEGFKSSKNELIGDNILIPEWGNNTVDIYTVFDEDKKSKKIKMSVSFDLGGTYLKSSEQKEKYNQAEKMIKDFAYKTTKDALVAKLKDQKNNLEDLEDKQVKLVKRNANFKEDILDNETKINNSKMEIVNLQSDITKKKKEVDSQKKVVDASAGAISEQEKSANKIYDKLKNQLEDLEKKEKNEISDIKSRTNKIEKLKEDISKNEQEQNLKKEEIETSKKFVDETKGILNKI